MLDETVWEIFGQDIARLGHMLAEPGNVRGSS
jgi:hypothetical protein